MAQSSVGGAIAAVVVSVAGLVVLVWVVWSFTPQGRERLKQSQARARAARSPDRQKALYPVGDWRFSPNRETSLEDYAAHLVLAHREQLIRLGILDRSGEQRVKIPLYRKWLFEVHGQCHLGPV